jgi:two-component system chemotaxis sensor kinase CheA
VAGVDRFKALFFEEAQELLRELESGLLELEARSSEREHVDRTFRAAHTLKGSAGMVGLRVIAAFTHKMEAVLDRIRSGGLKARSSVVDVLLEGRDYLERVLEACARGEPEEEPSETLRGAIEGILSGEEPADARASGVGEPADIVKSGSSSQAHLEGASSAAGERVERSVEPEAVRRAGLGEGPVILFDPGPDALRQGIDPVGVLEDLAELGGCVVEPLLDGIPAWSEYDPQRCYVRWRVHYKEDVSLERVRETALFVGPSCIQVEGGPPAPGEAERGDEAQPKVGVTASLATSGSGAAAGASGMTAGASAVEKAAPGGVAGMAGRGTAAAQRVRVDAQLLDRLIGLAGELAVLTDNLQTLGNQPWAEPWADAIESLDQVGRHLRDSALELRMVPVEDLFARLPRLIRDLAERSGKKIALKVEGEETQLDRAIIERLAEPMIHLIRNAVDHGLEPPEERVAAGKGETGQILVRAGHEGDRVSIRLEDDGRGLDREKIRLKGIRLGLLTPDVDAEDPLVANVIFEPGFSTRDVAGELSGRGVGLDVVRDALRALRGSVSVESQKGAGTVFTLQLPLTLALVDGLLVEVAEEKFVVPLAQVEECVAEGAGSAERGPGNACAVVRGELVPIVSLRKRLRIRGTEPEHPELLLTRQAGRLVAIAVDRLLGRIQTVIQPLADELTRLGIYSGATILGDGTVALVLDLASVIVGARRSQQQMNMLTETQ